MKIARILLTAVFLTGCADASSELEKGMELRSQILKAEQVCFSADISADYGDSIQLFSVDCSSDNQGDLTFTVTAPETIAGITGRISQDKGFLTFDGTALCFTLLTDEQLNPASAPWILMRSIRSGYLTSAGMEGELLRLTIDDSYDEDALQLDIWTTEDLSPNRAEICYDGRTILTMAVREFHIL